MSLRDLIHRVNEGDPVSSSQQNLTIEELLRTFSGWSSTAGPAGNTIHPAIYSIPIRVLNSTGVDLKRYEVVGLDDFYYDPSDTQKFVYWLDEIAFVGVLPDIDKHKGRYAIVQDAIAKNQVGLAKVAGATQVKLNVVNEDHEWAEIADDEVEYLETGGRGSAWILKKESGTGEKWAIVRLGTGPSGPEECCFKNPHPGRGVVFEVYRSTGWSPSAHRWIYNSADSSTIAKAIDWWCDDVPDLPGAGARAYFQEMPSDEHGIIMALCGNCDCDSPGSCDDEGTECGDLT